MDGLSVCNGDGDGLISMSSSAPSETTSAWRQLALANMISAGIIVVPDSIGGEEIGSTVPSSKVSGAGYIMTAGGLDFGDGLGAPVYSSFDSSTNAVFIGKVTSGERGLGASALKTEDAFNLDKKIDDGSVNGSAFSGATTGNFRSVSGGDNVLLSCLNGANYDLTVTTVICESGMALN